MTPKQTKNIIKIGSLELEVTNEALELLKLPCDEFIDINRQYLDSIGEKYHNLKDQNGKINPLECPLHAWIVYNHITCDEHLYTIICPLCGNFMCSKCMAHKTQKPLHIRCLPLGD